MSLYISEQSGTNAGYGATLKIAEMLLRSVPNVELTHGFGGSFCEQTNYVSMSVHSRDRVSRP